MSEVTLLYFIVGVIVMIGFLIIWLVDRWHDRRAWRKANQRAREILGPRDGEKG